MARLAPQGFTCKIERPEALSPFQTLYRELLIAFIATLLFSALLSYILARLSLRPMHEAYELMDEFVHAMIHDLNTPIAVAELNCNALLKSELTALQTRKLERVHKSMQRLLGLQKQLRSSMEKIHYDYREPDKSDLFI
ncbi:MAG: histidine kinase dimerization/phospho-acceptor domain-containing protein [Campylobacterota bacterium]|nr:histidine kinase dimerization/phospho-acceptor domain-containing protein [Campylobacterota bacterium]